MSKFNSTFKTIFSTASLVAVMTLTACGGGGGSSAPAASGTTTPVAPVSGGSGTLTTTQPTIPSGTVPIITAAAPTPTYAVGSEELAAFNQINLARSTCGFGTVRQNTLIDLAAFNHINWMAYNNIISHNEISNTTGFTGLTVGSRFNYVGYTNWAQGGEVLTQTNASVKAGYGLQFTRALLAAPYHLMGLADRYSEVGISVKTSGPTGSGADIAYPGSAVSTWLVADLGASPTYPLQSQTTTDVLTYPCQGVTNTATGASNESPNPIANRNLATSPIGQPVIIQVQQGQVLTITTSSIVTTIGSNPVQIATTLTSANDANYMTAANKAIIIPNAPLAANTQYTVTIQGTNNGALFTKSFTFTTGA